MPNPKISLLLLTHNRYQMTRYCLLNLLSKTGYSDFELLILDNGSTDERIKNLEIPPVQSGSIIYQDTNIGIAAGFNKLLRKAKGEYIVFLTNDILLEDNWLQDLLTYNNEIDKAGLTSIFYEGEKGVYGPLLNTIDGFTNVWSPTKNITKGVSLISRVALEDVGAMDESLGLYGREREQYAIRLANLGYKNFYCPGQFSTHLGREVNDNSQYKQDKDKGLQLSANRYAESVKKGATNFIKL